MAATRMTPAQRKKIGKAQAASWKKKVKYVAFNKPSVAAPMTGSGGGPMADVPRKECDACQAALKK